VLYSYSEVYLLKIRNLKIMKYIRQILGLLIVMLLAFGANGQQMKKDMEFLADDKLEGREVGTDGEAAAAKYIAKRFKKLGLEAKGTKGYLQEFSVKPRYNPHARVPADTSKAIVGQNIVGYIDNGAATTVILGAHYDHLGYGGEGSLYEGAEPQIHNGADDNASGVTVLLELATTLRGKYPHNNYLFIAFSGEEKGLWGSSWYTKNPTIDLAAVNYMINMDMVGRLGDDRELAIYGTGTSPTWMPVLEELSKTRNIDMKSKPSGVGPSDHTSFYLKDMPVLHFFTGQHDDYHKPSDDFDKIDYAGLQEIHDYIIDVIAACDSKGKLEFTKTKDEDSRKAPAFSVTLGVIPDYMHDGKGMLVSGVREGRPADKAGIKDGDIVIKMGELDIPDMMGYMKALAEFKKGDKVKVIVLREGEELEVEVEF
jgi:Zn-dependent M28 family amino/carboxypeptidase